MHGLTLAALPLSGRIFCTLFLFGIGCGALAAFAQAATAVGLTPAEVRASLAPEMPITQLGHGPASAEREMSLGEVSSAARVWIRTPLLIQTSHTHLFGQTLIAGLLGLIFLFAAMPEGLKAAILSLPFAGTVLDIGGMWLTRFVWPGFAAVVLVGGALFATGYVLIAAISLWQLWVVREARS